MTFRFKQPSSKNLTLGERGAPLPAPRTYLFDATRFRQAVSSMVQATINSTCCLHPTQLSEKIFRNLDRKRKRGVEGKGSLAATTPGVGELKRHRMGQSSSNGAPKSARERLMLTIFSLITTTQIQIKIIKSQRYVWVKVQVKNFASSDIHHLTTQGSYTSPPAAVPSE